jgi:hypothetical protein
MEQETLFEGDPPSEGTSKDSTRPRKATNVTIPGTNGPGNRLQGWVQSDKKAHDFMWKVGMKNATALPLLHYMVAHINRGSGGMVISASALAKELGVTARTIQSAINVLKNCNFIQVLKSGNTNVYIINSQVAWQGNRGMRNATFNATIKVTEEEQDVPVDQLIEEGEALVPVPEMSFTGDLNLDVIDMPADKAPRFLPEDNSEAS